MRKMFKLIILLAFTLAPLLSHAEEKRIYKEPQVEYSADSYMEAEKASVKAKVFHAPGKERREMTEAGGVIMIVRRDKRVAWQLIPREKMYMEINLDEIKKADNYEDMSDMQIEQTILGTETLEGLKTTKSRITATNKKGSRLTGLMWESKEGIIVKLDGTAEDKGRKTSFKTWLTNIKIGRQDPGLFEIPAGYSLMSMPKMPGFNIDEMMKERGEGKRPARKEQPSRKEQPAMEGRSYTSQPRGDEAVEEPVEGAKSEVRHEKEREEKGSTLEKVVDPLNKLRGLWGR